MKRVIVVLTLIFLPLSAIRSQDDITLFKLVGKWTGTMPCADCESIAYTLQLKRNFSFLDQMVYTGKNVDPFVSDGNWKFRNDSTIELTASNGTKSIYRLLPNEMVMIDDKGDPMPAPTPGMFHLTRSHSTEDDMSGIKFMLNEKRKSGVRFYGHGNEPFWDLEIYEGGRMKFTQMSEVADINIVSSKTILLTEVQGVNYNGSNDSFLVNVDLFAEECFDDMSGAKFTHRVVVKVQGIKNNVMKDFTGCGSYLYDSDLNRSWKLSKFKDKKLSIDEFVNGLPTMNFDLNTSQVSGNAGCNSYNGKAEALDNDIKFGGDFVTTRMSCPQLDFEQEFLASLKGKTFEYVITDNTLTLKRDKEIVMEFAGVK